MRKIKPFHIIVCLIYVFTFVRILSAESTFQKGICYAAWERERYASSHSDTSLKLLSKTGAEWVEVVVTCYQQSFNSKRIFRTQKTPSDSSLTHLIKQAHQLGLKVMLKPHLDLIDTSDGLWRGDICFQTQEEWNQWFKEYLKFLLYYARLAENNKVELFCIGTELSLPSTQSAYWDLYIIPQIRQVYSGKLVYAANWDEYKDVRFWDSLDYVGIDAYFPLSDEKNAGLEKLEYGWKKWADEIEDWVEKINKPVIFTEIGYRSCDSAAIRPWDFSSKDKINLDVQASCYGAVLKGIYNRAWCHGIYWWYWNTSPYAGGMANRDFTPQNKPAEKILTYWYQREWFVKTDR